MEQILVIDDLVEVLSKTGYEAEALDQARALGAGD